MTNKRVFNKKNKKKSPKSAQSLGLVKFQVPSPQRVYYNYIMTSNMLCSNVPQIHLNNHATCRFQFLSFGMHTFQQTMNTKCVDFNTWYVQISTNHEHYIHTKCVDFNTWYMQISTNHEHYIHTQCVDFNTWYVYISTNHEHYIHTQCVDFNTWYVYISTNHEHYIHIKCVDFNTYVQISTNHEHYTHKTQHIHYNSQHVRV